MPVTAGKRTASKSSAPTEYVVLKQVTAKDGQSEQPGWLLVGTYTAGSKTSAIRQHTGDGPDVLEGVWRAVPVSSWRGGVSTRRVTAAERLPLDGAS